MWRSGLDASPDQFREQAHVIAQDAVWFAFWMLALTTVAGIGLLGSIDTNPTSLSLELILTGLLYGIAVMIWARTRRDADQAFQLINPLVVLAIFFTSLSDAATLSACVLYAFCHVITAASCGRWRIARNLALLYLCLIGIATLNVEMGWYGSIRQNATAINRANMLAFAVSSLLSVLNVHTGLRRQQRLTRLFDDALLRSSTERDRAQQAAELRANMIDELSQEIRIPMTGVMGATQLLEQQNLSPAQRHLVTIQKQGSNRLLLLVNEMLDRAKLDAEHSPMDDQVFSPRDLVAEVAELYAPQAHRKNVELGWCATLNTPELVQGDATRVRQILGTLVANAVKFTHIGLVQINLSIGTDDLLIFEVNDNGKGIAASTLGHIFEPNPAKQPHAENNYAMSLPNCRLLARQMGGELYAHSTPMQGSDFALSLRLPSVASNATLALRTSKNFVVPDQSLVVLGASPSLAVKLHVLLTEMRIHALFSNSAPMPPSKQSRGEFEGLRPTVYILDAWPGHGSCLGALPTLLSQARQGVAKLILVCDVAHESTIDMPDSVLQLFRPLRREHLHNALVWAYGKQTVNDALAEQARMRVLLVDDNAINLMLGRALLELLDVQVEVAVGGCAAVELSSQQYFDLILMDLSMPDLDGIAATRQLHARQRQQGHSPTPVVAFTAQSDPQILAQCQTVGMVGILSKPYSIEQLRAVLEPYMPLPQNHFNAIESTARLQP